ncbi:2-succinyl-5-enolpyruvyl-6-hydroxy-3-cyclohexene-1-carboxylic-acid synthase [Actinomyces gaoshouyii]|uniref:2-succinyl-5-enolpyruvyl-6-hydroxy-3- cyclohexene-1-carboxylic-acid synthase n=1 Tax=Actinomyces gaoshouyii TaxID=1960083 RepID=UPI0009BE9FE9|nr:2-succinyl-5-enolpyruvyl-6-hydroxy-3-cyclohexene-1-carboxylic-acid synthase [Actinomyces gaoshouyii]ARD42301.1 2-succinyl-5-enolpyruvyl-6-hydroxy-3-cyclohexene-1-carboxylic-acid synthase [Actinomyces gaoshouyii]
MQPPSLTAAAAIVEALVATGVRWAVLSPGSRSAPMAYALAEAEAAGLLGLRVVLDERSAGFTALGMSRAAILEGRRAPAAVVTTSGTAVANLHPALAEADAAGIPLVVISTDRPHELVGTGANQTTAQAGIFALAPRATADIPADLTAPGPAGLGEEAGRAAITGQVRRAVLAAAGTLTRDPGPAHINARFRPPLTPGDGTILGESRPRAAYAGPAKEPAAPAPRLVWEAPGAPANVVDEGGGAPGLIIAGDCPDPALGALAARVAERLGWPLLAEPTSGARHGATAQSRYAELLATRGGRDLARRARSLLVVGHPSLSRPVSALLARDDVRISILADRARITDVAGTARRVIDVEPAGTPDGLEDQAARIAGLLDRAGPSWAADWTSAVAALSPLSGPWGGAVAAPGDPRGAMLTADEAALTVWESCTLDHAGADAPLLVVGSSMTIRRLDRLAPVGAPAPTAVANRGLAGIDGTIATAGGLALASGRPVRALMGDLAFLHDAMSLGHGELECEPDLQVIVLDDAGGSIFKGLEYAGVPGPKRFSRLFSTPQRADVANIARGLGVDVIEAPDRDSLERVMAQPVRGSSVVRVPCPPVDER